MDVLKGKFVLMGTETGTPKVEFDLNCETKRLLVNFSNWATVSLRYRSPQYDVKPEVDKGLINPRCNTTNEYNKWLRAILSEVRLARTR